MLIEEKIEIELLYKKGLKAKEIKEKLEAENKVVSLKSIDNYISKKLKDFRAEHKKNAKKILHEKIAELYKKGCTLIEIGEKVSLSPNTIDTYISLHLKHIREEHIKNVKLDLIKKISYSYEKGLTTSEIGRDLGISASTVKNYTSTLVELKKEHNINYNKRQDIKREDNRILTKENNAIMSVKDFVMRNINAYDQKEDGSYVFNCKSGVATWDTPKRYVVNI